MGRIPEDVVSQIIASTNVVELIGQHVRLKRVGSQYKGLCPFHHEKTPSFQVNPARNSYHCFGCGAGGTAVGFVMAMENLSFPDALRQLAKRAGIVVQEEDDGPGAARERQLKDRLYALHTAAAEWFHEVLLRNSEAEEARAYLKKRGFGGDAVREWRMGYAPLSSGALMEWGRKSGFDQSLLESGGLLYAPDDDRPGPNRPTARFRDRLMFPIATEFGQIVGFSGRVLQADAKGAKYLNSPETPIFQKSRLLFGMDKAKRAILRDRRAVLCEGQLDTIAASEAGVKSAVAPLGTAFTEFHVRILHRHADEIILCFDGDEAGQKAAARACEILAPAGLIVRMADVPPGEDPDSLIKGEGPEAFRARLDAAKDFHEAQVIRGMKRPDAADIRERVKLAGEVASTLALMPDRIARDAALHTAAVRLGVGLDDLRVLVAEKSREIARQNRPNSQKTEPAPVSAFHAQNRVARDLCRLLLADPEARAWSAQTDFSMILRELPGTELLALLVEKSLPSTQSDVLARVAAMEPAAQSELGALLSSEVPTGGVTEANLLFQKLEVERLLRLRAQFDARLKTPGLDSETMLELLGEVTELTRLIEESRHPRMPLAHNS